MLHQGGHGGARSRPTTVARGRAWRAARRRWRRGAPGRALARAPRRRSTAGREAELRPAEGLGHREREDAHVGELSFHSSRSTAPGQVGGGAPLDRRRRGAEESPELGAQGDLVVGETRSTDQRSFGGRAVAPRRCSVWICGVPAAIESDSAYSASLDEIEPAGRADRRGRVVCGRAPGARVSAEPFARLVVGELEDRTADPTCRPCRGLRHVALGERPQRVELGRPRAPARGGSGVVPLRPVLGDRHEVARQLSIASSSDMKAVPRSKLNVTIATRQPSFSSPTRLATGMRTSSRNISLNSLSP